jgi:HTH-type transcriptional regulator / antitoxin HipB
MVYLGHVGTSLVGVSASCLGERELARAAPDAGLVITYFCIFQQEKVRKDPDVLLRKIGRRVRQRRQDLGLTQKELADRLGITSPNITIIEHGEQNLTIRTLVKLADALGMTVVVDLVDPE